MTDQLREALRAIAHEPYACNGLHVELEEGLRAIAALATPSPDTLDVDRLHRAILDELAELWGEPSDGISAQIRPIVARNIIDRYARLREATNDPT